MSRRDKAPLDLLLVASWWVSAVIAVGGYAVLRWLIPALAEGHQVGRAIAGGVATLAPYFAFLFGLVAVASAAFAAKRRRLVDQQSSLETLRAMSWKGFEFMVAEAYRRQGFAVEFSLGRGADGGVDLVLRGNGRVALVQCKQWKAFSVGAPIIRELFGIMTAEHADEAVVVTSGRFTSEARAFAKGKPISLVDGPQLLDLVKSVQASEGGPVQQHVLPAVGDGAPGKVSPERGAAAERAIPSDVPQEPSPLCPQCGSRMVLRTAKRGERAGQQFWGCPAYPRCKGTRAA